MVNTAAIKSTVFGCAVLISAAAPLLVNGSGARPQAVAGFPGWPTHFEGRPLTPLPMSEREQSFARGFPGLVQRFDDGHREIIVRYVTEPTRLLHPAADCLRGAGYRVSARPARRDATGAPMSCLVASRNGAILHVCEVIHGKHGRWSDVSSWYWSALFDAERGPWWSYVIAEGRPG